ncbi:MAG: hypothetical protein KJ760_19695 [Proteobacteria bacterium]|nr:hypothetical protein [Pseudomonadota bacterium]
MPTECDLLKAIETYAKALARAVAAAEYCLGKTLEAIEQECQKRLAEIEAEYKRSTATAAQAYDGSPREEKADLAALEPGYGLAEFGWDAAQWQNFAPRGDAGVPYITRVGWLTAKGKYDQIEMPALLPIIGSRNVLIKASGAGKAWAREAIHSIMLRLLATLLPGKLRFVCIDLVGLGATMAGFIKELPDLLTDGQARFDASHIEGRLADLEPHSVTATQKYLGARYATMEDLLPQGVTEPDMAQH